VFLQLSILPFLSSRFPKDMHIFRKLERWNVSTGTSWSLGPEHARYKWLNGTGIPKLDFRRTRFRFLEWLRWGWVFLKQTQILSGIQFRTHFIDFFVVETKRFVSSTVNVILTRQTCGQRSSKAAESKRRALGNYFSGRISICSQYQHVKETEI